MFRHILIPTDGSELSSRAVQAGVQFARSLNASVSGFYVEADLPAPVYGEYGVMHLLTPEQFRAREAEQARNSLAVIEKAAKDAGVACETESVISDNPWQAITEAVKRKGCDLIFMASHGRRGIDALLLGSETNKVLTYSSAPVLVVR